MNNLVKDDMLGHSSGLSLGLGHGEGLNDGLNDGFHNMSGQPPPQPSPNMHATSVFKFERNHKDKNHTIVRAVGATLPGLPPVLSVLFTKSKPNVVIFAGDAPGSASIFGDGSFSKLSTNHKLFLRGVPIDFHGDNAGNYVFESSAMGCFTWSLDEMSGNLQALQDVAGMQVARFKEEGMLSGVKTLEIVVNATAAMVEFIIFSAAVTRIYEKETVKQLKKGGKIGDVVSAVFGS